MTKLEQLAAEVAILAPDKQHKYAATAYIPWKTVQEIRAELEARGFDWRTTRAEMLQSIARRRAEIDGRVAKAAGR